MKRWIGIAIGMVLVAGGIWLVLANDRKEIVVTEKVVEPMPTVVIEKLRFGVMSDVHNDKKNLENLLKISKDRQEEFIILTGDLTNVGAKQELLAIRRIMDENGASYYAVPGNHDLWTGQKMKTDIWGEVFGEDYTSFKKEDNKFILVNNGSWNGLGKEQRIWLDEEVKECRIIRCLVFMHMPLNHEFSVHIMGEDSKVVTKEAEELVELLAENGVREIFTGHLHYSGDYGIGGFRTTLVGAVNEARNNQTPRFTEVRLTDKGVETEVVTGGIQ